MDSAVLALLGTLVEIKTELGPEVYEAALDRARLALAAEVMVEAERRAIRARGRRTSGCATGDVIAFPGNPPRGSN